MSNKRKSNQILSENICVELKNVELSFLNKEILNIPRLAVHQFDRIGIVGKNGSGKSSLLKLITGAISPDKGMINRNIEFAYFDQLALTDDNNTDYEWMSRLAVPKTELENFSGGEHTRLKLANLFSFYHEGLLIDEPTTHLDEAGINFLLNELTHYYGALLIVSHDRNILDQLVTKIWEIEDGHINEYTGNYTSYINQKELVKVQQEEKHEKYLQEKSRLIRAAEEKMSKSKKITEASKRVSKTEVKATANRMFMTKSKDTSQKGVARAAKALEQRMKQLEKVEVPKQESFIQFHQPEYLQLHNKFPIMANDLTLRAGDKLLLDDVSFQLPLEKTIAITGPNGSGKTTLLQHVLQDGSGLTISPKVVFGVYEQMNYRFTKDCTVLNFIKNKSDYSEGRIRSVLHAMDLKRSDLNKNVCSLSGGEAIRLVLCQLFLGKYNVLILDEPTNFLDIFSIEALEKLLQAYEGTVLLVSHDRTFIDKVADVEYFIKNHKLERRNDYSV